MRIARRALVALGTVLLLSACGRSVVVDAAPEATPYDGPLHVEVTAAPDDGNADRSGAAGRVVDCDFPSTGYSEPGLYQSGPVSRSPAAALTRELREYVTRGATNGLREARRDGDRVLYTYEVDRRVRQAVIVHHGPSVEGTTGWYVESWARCDWAELPAALADGLGLEVWTDGSGRRVPTDRIVSSKGPEHCDWQQMRFLDLDGGDLEDGQTYVEHPEADLYPDYVRVPYAASSRLPSDARDTHYERQGQHLWIAPDRSRAFVGTSGSVAVWPRTVQRLGCA